MAFGCLARQWKNNISSSSSSHMNGVNLLSASSIKKDQHEFPEKGGTHFTLIRRKLRNTEAIFVHLRWDESEEIEITLSGNCHSGVLKRLEMCWIYDLLLIKKDPQFLGQVTWWLWLAARTSSVSSLNRLHCIPLVHLIVDSHVRSPNPKLLWMHWLGN